MELFFFSLAVAVLVAGGLLYFLNKKFEELKKPADQDPVQHSMKMMLQMIGDLRRDIDNSQGKNRQELDRKLQHMTQLVTQHQTSTKTDLQKQFKQSAAIIQEVTKSLTHLQETNKQVVGFAEQMKSLENILKNPKQRGVLGEYFLESLLSQVLSPAQYKMQYKMENGEIVDAAIFYNDLIIPIDAKFSLEKYNQIMEEPDKERREKLEKAFKGDVKNRIDETSKYIRPTEGTTEFAFMFIPAEGIYYNLLIYNVGSVNVNTEHLIEYAFRKHVIIVSPTSFFAYLETVLHGLKGKKMEEGVKEVLKNVEKLGKHINAYDEYMGKLGKHLGTTVGAYNNASREFKKIDKDFYKLSEGKVGGDIELLALEKPVEKS
jgi:DNA recombination protein RmuC